MLAGDLRVDSTTMRMGDDLQLDFFFLKEAVRELKDKNNLNYHYIIHNYRQFRVCWKFGIYYWNTCPWNALKQAFLDLIVLNWVITLFNPWNWWKESCFVLHLFLFISFSLLNVGNELSVWASPTATNMGDYGKCKANLTETCLVIWYIKLAANAWIYSTLKSTNSGSLRG